ncbi:RNA polymerase sigma factor [Luteitalea pratensis]|uniref:RNA polymerase sigma factor n=1 Tax=Luteitalea pratensis TaxID=1855912 RepID=UPI0012FF8746|nr:RNA polymerase sigma factor [Luteitalea pratensis]
MARAQGGMPDAWAELVHRHHGAVFRTAHAALVSSADADDAAQEAWIAAWKALGEFRGRSSFRTWLLAIAWRKALDRRRGVAGWMRMLRIERGEDDDGRSVELTATGIDAETTALDRTARARLKTLVKGLPRAHRDALLLVATQELTYAEAAALLDAPVGTVKWRVSDARRLLRERMQRQDAGLRKSAIGLRRDT